MNFRGSSLHVQSMNKTNSSAFISENYICNLMIYRHTKIPQILLVFTNTFPQNMSSQKSSLISKSVTSFDRKHCNICELLWRLHVFRTFLYKFWVGQPWKKCQWLIGVGRIRTWWLFINFCFYILGTVSREDRGSALYLGMSPLPKVSLEDLFSHGANIINQHLWSTLLFLAHI